MTQVLNSLADYAFGNPNVRRTDFGAFGVTVDESHRADVDLGPSPSHIILIDMSGTDHRFVQIGGVTKEGPSNAGSLAFIPAGNEARLSWDCDRSTKRCMAVDVDPATLVSLVPELFARRHALSFGLDIDFRINDDMLGLASLLVRQAAAEGESDSLFRQSLFHSFIVGLATHLNGQLDLPAQRRDRRLQRAIDFIEENFTRDVSLDEICRAAACSATQLTDLFRRCLNQTPYSYVIDRRLSEAMRLLRNDDEPIALLALSCGFADQQHMTRLFRARLGSTPLVYRRDATLR